MHRTESTRSYGRTAVNHAELPASPAAATNGNSGKQQLDAATALASAAVLAKIVVRPVCRLLLGTAILPGFGEFANGIPDERNARPTLRTTRPAVRPAAHARGDA